MGPDIDSFKGLGEAQAGDIDRDTLCLPLDFPVSSPALFMFSHLGKCKM